VGLAEINLERRNGDALVFLLEKLFFPSTLFFLKKRDVNIFSQTQSIILRLQGNVSFLSDPRNCKEPEKEKKTTCLSHFYIVCVLGSIKVIFCKL
jgi:hypothetical protein